MSGCGVLIHMRKQICESSQAQNSDCVISYFFAGNTVLTDYDILESGAMTHEIIIHIKISLSKGIDFLSILRVD